MSTAFGTALKDVLTAHGLSLSRAADRAEVSHSCLSRIIAGQRQPGRETVQQIADGLRLSAEESRLLFEAAGYMPVGVVSALLPRELREAAETLDDASIPQPYRDSLRLQISALVGITRQMAEAA